MYYVIHENAVESEKLKCNYQSFLITYYQIRLSEATKKLKEELYLCFNLD